MEKEKPDAALVRNLLIVQFSSVLGVALTFTDCRSSVSLAFSRFITIAVRDSMRVK